MNYHRCILIAVLFLCFGQNQAFSQSRTQFGGESYPKIKVRTQKYVGYLIPLAEFGGYDSTLRHTGKTIAIRRFDKKGRIKTYQVTGENLNDFTEYTYNWRGLPKQKLQYNGNKRLKMRSEYEFWGDSLRCITTYNGEGQVIEKYFTYYDAQGIITRQISNEQNSPQKVLTLFEYDSLNNLCLTTKYKDGVYTSHVEYYYEGKNLIMRLYYDATMGLRLMIKETYHGQEQITEPYRDGKTPMNQTKIWTLRNDAGDLEKQYTYHSESNYIDVREYYYEN